MRGTTTVLCGALLLAAAVPAKAQRPHLAPHRAAIHVTGQPLPLATLLARGLTLQQAQVQRQLDELAREGLDKAMLTRSAAAMETVMVSSGTQPAASVFLSPGGRLVGTTNAVLEERYLPSGKDKQALQLVARDGLTGAVLWSRRDTFSNDSFLVAIPGTVGRKAGVILLKSAFSYQGSSQSFLGLDGSGKKVWDRTLKQSAEKSASGYSGSFSFTQLDRHFRSSGPEIAYTVERSATKEDAAGNRSSSGSVTFMAISQATGAVRTLPGGLSSADGVASGSVVSDQTGDGLDDLVSTDGGSRNLVVLTRGTGGQVWSRTDIALNGYAYVEEVGALTGAKAGGRAVQDLAVLTQPTEGVLGSPLGLIADPTTGTHGQVVLVRGVTGTTVWSKPGDYAYAVQSGKGLPALGVASDESSSSPTAETAKITLDVFDLSGATLWSRTSSLEMPHAPTSQDYYFTFAVAGAAPDLDEDGGYEAFLFLFILDADSGEEVSHVDLLRSSDGSAVKDSTSDFLGGSVTGKGEDRTRVTAGKKGLNVTLIHGISGTALFSRLVPGSAGITNGYASGYRLRSSPCLDVLVEANGHDRAVVGVLAGNGVPRWTVSRVASDLKLGTITAPKTAPRARC